MTAAPATEPAVTIPSRLFGPLTVAPSSLIRFPDGLLGFGGDRTFALLAAGAEGCFWLQASNEGALAFLTVDPFRFVNAFLMEVPDATAAEEEARAVGQLLVLVLVTLPAAEGERPTANLQAPILLDLRHRTARQVVLEQLGYTTRHPIALPRPA